MIAHSPASERLSDVEAARLPEYELDSEYILAAAAAGFMSGRTSSDSAGVALKHESLPGPDGPEMGVFLGALAPAGLLCADISKIRSHDRQGRCFGSRETVWKLVRKFRVSGLLLGCFGGWETKGGNQETCGKLTYLDTRNSLSGVREREILRKRVGNRWETQRFGTMSAVSSLFPHNFPLMETPKPFLGARNIRETCRKHHDS